MGETSPHTRGKRLFAWLVRDGLRNIPAYAGKTHSANSFITLT